MKKILMSLAIVSVMLVIIAVPAMAFDQDVPASVTVTTVIDVTITDAGSNNIQFGEVDAAGVTDTPDIHQSADDSVPAVTITINSATNVLCNMLIRGTDFHDPDIPITGASWALGSPSNPKFYMKTSDQTFDLNRAAGHVTKLSHFLTVPADPPG